MSNPIFRFGAISAAILFILSWGQWLVLGTSISYSTAEVLGYASMLLSLFFVFLGIREYRDKVADGRLSFGRGLKVGLLISLFPSVVAFIGGALFTVFFGEQFKTYALDDFKKNKSAEEYEQLVKQMESMGDLANNPIFQGVIMFLTVLVLGFIVSLISAWILKRSEAVAV